MPTAATHTVKSKTKRKEKGGHDGRHATTDTSIYLLIDDASSGGHVRQPIKGQQLLAVTTCRNPFTCITCIFNRNLAITFIFSTNKVRGHRAIRNRVSGPQKGP